MATTPDDTVSVQPLDCQCPLQALPAELCWMVVDALLLCKGGAQDATRLGLTCRQLALTILDDEGSWRSRCNRDMGTDRMGLHTEHKRFGVGWPQLYAAAKEGAAFGRRFATILNGLCDATGYIWRWTSAAIWECGGYAVEVSISSMPLSIVVTERALHDTTKDVAGWASVRRVKSAGTDAARCCLGFDLKQTFCACVFCRGDSCDARELVRARIETYRGGWRNHCPHGTGRATFVNGLVYDGEWDEGLPHGRGSLCGGAALDWFRGVCVVRAQACGCRIRGIYGCCVGNGGDADRNKWRYDGHIVVRSEQDPTRCIDQGASSDLGRWYQMADGPGGGEWRTLCPVIVHGFGTAVYADGTVFAGLWNRGNRESGTCTTPDGTAFTGRWSQTCTPGIGQTRWPSGASTRCMVWHWRNRPRVYEYSTYADAHKHALCGCPTTDTSVLGTRRRPWLSRHATVRLRNGDTVVFRYGRDGSMVEGVHSFTFSADCKDPAFAAAKVDCRSWTCEPLPRRAPLRPCCPDDYIYWPSDSDSKAWAKFALYVERGLIGWDEEAIAFWHTIHAPSADPTRT
nr:phosphatidylinositol phosphate kinase motif-containing protein [Pandoravirus massiliensis]